MQVLKPEVRAAMIEAARIEFIAKGYRDATIRSIAARIGMSCGNLYRYFKNKDELFWVVVDYFREASPLMAKRIQAQRNLQDKPAKLLTLVAALSETTLDEINE